MNEKLKIISTSDLYSKDKKKTKPDKKTLTTKDLSDEAIHQAVEESKPTKIVKTSDVTDSKDEKE